MNKNGEIIVDDNIKSGWLKHLDIADLCDIFKNTAHTPDAINQIISHIDKLLNKTTAFFRIAKGLPRLSCRE